MSAVPPSTDITGSVNRRSDLWLRKWNLSLFSSLRPSVNGRPMEGVASPPLVISTEQEGFDLRIHFTIKQCDAQTPNTAVITIYNLADKHARQIIKEYDRVELQAGYVGGHYGLVFAGEIKQYKLGRENAIDSYLTIYAGDGIKAYARSRANDYIPAGYDSKKFMDVLRGNVQAQTENPNAAPAALPSRLPGGVMPRGRPVFGGVVAELRDWAKDSGCSWSFQNGQLEIYNQRQYSGNEIVKLTAQTGMVGVPESTEEGILVQCLINPAIRIRGRIQLENKSINTYYVPGGDQESIGMQRNPLAALFPGFSDFHFYATTSQDGVYTVLVIDMEGDTRGLPWYMWLTCWSTDPTAPKVDAIQGIDTDPQMPASGF